MHNIRIIRDNPINFCMHKQRGVAENGAGLNPERLQTSMSLYSDKLSGIVLMVDGRVNSSMRLKEGNAVMENVVCVCVCLCACVCVCMRACVHGCVRSQKYLSL